MVDLLEKRVNSDRGIIGHYAAVIDRHYNKLSPGIEVCVAPPELISLPHIHPQLVAVGYLLSLLRSLWRATLWSREKYCPAPGGVAVDVSG